MDENSKRHLLSTFDDIIELMATQGQKVVCSRLQEVRQLLREQPKIILCKDCKYWLPMNRFDHDYHPGRGQCELNCWVRDSDWFCADGERKEGAVKWE